MTPDNADQPSTYLVGGPVITRKSTASLLRTQGISVPGDYKSVDELLKGGSWSNESHSDSLPNTAIAIMGKDKYFSKVLELGKAIQTQPKVPVILLAEKVTNYGEVKAALNSGVKGYVDMEDDDGPDTLVRAVQKLANNQMGRYMSSSPTRRLWDMAEDPGVSSPLTKRELQVTLLTCECLTLKGIARQMRISPKTVENHRLNIYRKTGVDSIAGLVIYAIRQGIFSP